MFVAEVLVNRLHWQHEIVRCAYSSCKWTSVCCGGCSRWMNLPSWSSTSSTAHKFFWQQQFFQQTVMVATVPFWNGLTKPNTSGSSHRSWFQWQSRNEFTCEQHTHSYRILVGRSLSPKSKAVAEKRSSVKISNPPFNVFGRKCWTVGSAAAAENS